MMESEVCGLYAQPKEIEGGLKITKTIFNIVQSVDFTYSTYLSNAPQKGLQGKAPQWILYCICSGLKSKLLYEFGLELSCRCKI